MSGTTRLRRKGSISHPGDLGMRTFGEDVLEEFLRINGLKRMVRKHLVLEDGYQWWFGERLLSLFSVPDHCGMWNLGAVGVVVEGGNIEVVTFSRISAASMLAKYEI